MAGLKRSSWSPGAIYAIPLPDGSFGVGQTVDAMMLNVVYLAVLADRFPQLPSTPPILDRNHVVSLVATTRRDLSRGAWPLLGAAPLVAQKSEFSNELFASRGYVGARIYDAALIADFLAAYHGLLPWNVLAREDYYDDLLAPGVERPSDVVLLEPDERKAYRAMCEGPWPPVV